MSRDGRSKRNYWVKTTKEAIAVRRVGAAPVVYTQVSGLFQQHWSTLAQDLRKQYWR